MKNKKNVYLLLLLCVVNTAVFSNPLVHLDSLELAKTKIRILNGTASTETFIAYNTLITQADKLLSSKNPSVIDKTILPPSGNKHDYLSIGRYWWPDTAKKDGLPWVRLDGKTNPETQSAAVDRKRLYFMGKSVRSLSLAYYFTENEKYAHKAISMVSTWFINPETLMNPNLEFAQSVPGYSKKRPYGILDGRSLVMFVPDAIQLLSVSKYWNANYETKITTWFSDYLTWLTQSDLGIEASQLENNHVSWYRYQVASLALYLDNIPLIQKMVTLAEQSLEDMLDTEGGQIHELARSRSFFYSCFNLQALTSIADLGDQVGMDMWQYTSENGKSLSLAINYLTPIANGEKWNHNTLKEIDLIDFIPVLSKASKHLNSEEYKALLSKILLEHKEERQNDKVQAFWLLYSLN